MKKLTLTILALSVISGCGLKFSAKVGTGKSNANTKRVLWADSPVIIGHIPGRRKEDAPCVHQLAEGKIG